ncbi:MAG: type II/IV secretion system protein [Candidatus Fermentibacteraceae bacterium]|nr:type II/IV secretion system protein [Candidatus Fermentibacteraceae bacterium]
MRTIPEIDIQALPRKLNDAGILSDDGLERLSRFDDLTDENMLNLMVARGLVPEELLYKFLAGLTGLPYKVLDPLELDYQIVTDLLPGAFAQKHHLVVFDDTDSGLKVATCNLRNTRHLEDLSHMLGRDIQLHVGRPSEIARVIRQFYGLHGSITAAVKEMDAREVVDLGNLERYVSSETDQKVEPTDQPIVNAVNHLLQYAFEERASDIHLEPHRKGTVVRLRIDGVLHDIYKIPRKLHPPILSRIKMISGLNIAEKRRPQDGRIRTLFDGKPVEIRTSTVPVAFGEKVVLRILDPAMLMQDLAMLGFRDDDLARYKGSVGRPNGLILVTGPTGSGKTTTLYSTLTILATKEKNITTVEDPIEFVTDEFNQIAVQPAIDITFSSSLKYILRQDPDIIMVGEIRDTETARSAMRCALTGHLVLSTLHTNDSASAAIRLVDMGVEPYLLSTTLLAVVAQRLVRTICDKCAEEYVPTASLRESIGLEDGVVLKRGVGCRNCRGTGYKGRIGVFEVLAMTEELRNAVVNRATIDEIRRLAVRQGMVSLRESTLAKVRAGITTPEEMLKVTLGVE